MQCMWKTTMIHPDTRVYSLQIELGDILYRTRQPVLFSVTISKEIVMCNRLECLFIYQERVTVSWMITYIQLMIGSLKTPKNNTLISKAANSSSRKFWQKLYERVLLAPDSNTKKAYRILCNDERLRVVSVTRILRKICRTVRNHRKKDFTDRLTS